MTPENAIAQSNQTTVKSNSGISTTTNDETSISEVTLEEFKNSLRGKVIYPENPGYDEGRKVRNAMINKRPRLIVECAGVTDIMRSVNFARENKLVVAVRGTGHNVAGSSVCEGGIVIDLAAMKAIRIDATRRTVRVEPGVTWGELSHELQFFGLAATGGFVSTTGVSGLTLGGGLGWLLRKHGLALDNLISVDIVTADGQLVTADDHQNEDLFWGVRGGGGNFGIVASFKFKVHPVGMVWGGLVLHPTSKGYEALKFWRDFAVKSPVELTGATVIFNPPSELPLPPVLHKEGVVAMGGVYAGSVDVGEEVLHPLRQFGPPAADIFQKMPYSAAQTMADFLWPKGFYNYWKLNFLDELSDDAIETILKFFAKAPSSHTVVVIEHAGDGAMNKISDDKTAFNYRDGRFNFLITSLWTDAADSDTNIRWTQDFYRAMEPFMARAAYLNYIGDEGEDRIKEAYGRNYQRLAALKARYDSDNLFCMNQNIKPVV